MNKSCWIFICLCCIAGAYAQQEITEKNYLEQDSALWDNYEKQQEELVGCWKAMPGKRDSIEQALKESYENACARNIELAVRYASVPSGLRRLYMVRLDLPKDTLERVLNSLPAAMQESFYGKNIRAHLQNKQVGTGDTIRTFPCFRADGTPFDWTEAEGKQLLLLYGGLGCMGEDGRKELQHLYDRTSRDDLLIVVYWPCDSLEALQQVEKQYPAGYRFISDFKSDASPIKILYGSQATPTCFLTDKQHVVKVKCTGLHTRLFNTYIGQNE